MSVDILDIPPPAPSHRRYYGPKPQQFGDLWLPPGAGPFPVATVIHGGFWRARYGLEYFGHVCADLMHSGVACWNIEYRRIGDAGGGWPGTFLDVAAAADYLRTLSETYPLDIGRMAAVGHSAGGHLALWLAGRPKVPAGSHLFFAEPLPISAVVGLGTVSSLRRCWELRLSGGAAAELMGGTPDEVPDRYAAADPAALLPLGARQVLVHGTADENVPFFTIEEYVEAAQAAGDDVRLLALEGIDHFAPVDPRSVVWPRVRRSILELLSLKR
jgi:acetyl esterase/lipase